MTVSLPLSFRGFLLLNVLSIFKSPASVKKFFSRTSHTFRRDLRLAEDYESGRKELMSNSFRLNCCGYNRIGRVRMRLPVAAKIAFTTAGAIGGVPGSPTPPCGSLLGKMYVSIRGTSLIRNIL